MKKLNVVVGLLAMGSALLGGQAMAACSGNALNVSQINSALSGNTVCGARGKERWQEYHAQGGNLIDYKMGPNDKVDPSKKVGSWSVTGNQGGNQAKVNYDYGSGGQSSYTVYSNGGGRYSFCGGGELQVSVLPGQVKCP